jgi:hypothetical protein
MNTLRTRYARPGAPSKSNRRGIGTASQTGTAKVFGVFALTPIMQDQSI